MPLTWVREDTPVWDSGKQTIVGGAPAGSLEVPKVASGGLAPGEWFRVEDGGVPVGYGWMDCTWGDAEVTLAVDSAHRGRGVGAFIVGRLEAEAASRGVNYLYNAVPATHPERARVTQWLDSLGFRPSGDGLMKKRVRRG
jgi:GNAT superfamily N-acetyltransferase